MASKSKRPTKRVLNEVREAYQRAHAYFRYPTGFVSRKHILSEANYLTPTEMVKKALERMVRTGEMERRQESVVDEPSYRMRAPLEQLARLGE